MRRRPIALNAVRVIAKSEVPCVAMRDIFSGRGSSSRAPTPRTGRSIASATVVFHSLQQQVGTVERALDEGALHVAEIEAPDGSRTLKVGA